MHDWPEAVEKCSAVLVRKAKRALELTAVPPMGTVPMGDDPRLAAVDSAGRHHHMEGLWVSDASLFPGSIGVPPQLSVYALGLHVGRALVARRGGTRS